jgi:uncharacterized circularly permuted ATP-grasp superfamily protein/uncharacterized alpha-E superfamily protein
MEQPDLTDATDRPAAHVLERAAALARAAEPGHFDEMRGCAAPAGREPKGSARAAPGPQAFAPAWQTFFEHLGADGFDDLDRRTRHLARQIRDNGVSYNVYADADNPQRPWSLDLFPLIVAADSWRQIEAGVLQRVQVLEAVMADVYGPRALVRAGLLPTALVRGHPGYLRSMHGVEPAGGTFLPIVAFDLARGPDGHWWVVSQRTQAPSGLGYLLENRLSISRLFPQAFEAMSVQRLAGTYRALIDGIKAMSPAGADAHIALLTPGPYNETYFEHAYLARYLGISLVQGTDLTVRDDHLYLRTLRGLEPIHGLIKRVDDAWLDPLELRPDSTLGVAGLLQAVRSGHVVMANAPGSAFLESSALLGFLPALADHLLGETLRLPALPTWWCGERAVLDQVLPRLGESVIKPTYPGWASHNSFEAVLGRQLPRRKLDEWAGRILRQGDEYTVQRALPLSQMPTWRTEGDTPGIAPRSAMLRVFALADGPRSWRVLPGGLVRIVGADAGIASMQRGGSSADAWVLTTGAVDRTTLLQPHLSPASISQRKRLVTSRAAENLFWLGRYTERTENCLRLCRLALETLNGEDLSCAPLLDWLTRMAQDNRLVAPGTPGAAQGRRVFERALVAGLADRHNTTSVGSNLAAVRQAASALRERLSQEHWNLIQRAEREFFNRSGETGGEAAFSTVEALRLLESVSADLAAMTGAQTDRMTRDDGWRLLSVGRQVERLGFLAHALRVALDTGAVQEAGGFEALVALFDTTITFHAQYQQSREIAALADLLVLSRENPRSLGWVVQTLRARLSRLAGSASNETGALAQLVPDPGNWSLDALCDGSAARPALRELLDACHAAAWRLSDEVSLRYFTHTHEAGESLGA